MRQYGCDLYKISQEIKRINWFSVEKLIIEREKTLYYNYKKVKLLYNEKYKKLSSFALMFQKKYKNFFIFMPCKFLPEI